MATADDRWEESAWWEWSRDGWKVACRVAVQGGHAVISEVRVLPEDSADVPSGGVTTSLLRAIATDGTLDGFRERFERFVQLQPDLVQDVAELGLDVLLKEPERVRPRRRNDQALALVAATYVRHVSEGIQSPRARPRASCTSARGPYERNWASRENGGF